VGNHLIIGGAVSMAIIVSMVATSPTKTNYASIASRYSKVPDPTLP
jgi:hypothetical protein